MTRRPTLQVYRPRLECLEGRCLLSVFASERVLHSFGDTAPQVFPAMTVNDGLQPEGDVTVSFDGSTLYGRTFIGGSDSVGVIYTMQADDLTGATYEILHSFAGQPNDGANPRHNRMLLSPDGATLYGMTVAGGSDNNGTVFSYDLTAPVSTAYDSFHSFKNSKGSTPHGTVIFSADGSTLYGMTQLGGAQDKGVLYALDLATQEVTVLYSFGQTPDGTQSDAYGDEPHGTPLLIGQHLYGMTRKGGVAPDGTTLDFGVIYDYHFATTPSDSPTMTILHTFGGQAFNDGATPYHGNLIYVDNVLYGMTTEGGLGTAPGNGIIFSYNLDPTVSRPYTVLHYFTGATNDGAQPEGTLSLFNNQLYGVGAAGGQFGKGAFFRINPDGSDFQVLYSFAGSPDGDHPIDSVALFVNPNGSPTFYGMTQQGGKYGTGSIYAITLDPINVVGAGPGGQPRVKVFNAVTGAKQFDFLAFDKSFRGGVRVAAGDVNGDGFPDIIVASDAGRVTLVKIYSGEDGSLLAKFNPYGMDFKGGASVAAGNFDADPQLEVVTGQGAGSQARVRAFDIAGGTGTPLAGPLGSFQPFGDGFRGGVNVAAGNFDGSNGDEVIVGKGSTGDTRVRVFAADLTTLANFLAFAADARGGTSVAAGDLDGDGMAEIIAGAGRGNRPNVAVFDSGDAAPLGVFLAYDAGFRGGVAVAATVNPSGNGQANILTGAGPGMIGPLVSTFDGETFDPLGKFFALDQRFEGGIVVGGS